MNSVIKRREHDDQVHVLYLILNVGVMICTWPLNSLHVFCSPSWGAFNKCPSSCAIVKATLKPLSSTTEQLRRGSQTLPSSANPRVSHFLSPEHKLCRVTKMAVSKCSGWLSSGLFCKCCHAQKLFSDLEAFWVIFKPCYWKMRSIHIIKSSSCNKAKHRNKTFGDDYKNEISTSVFFPEFWNHHYW